MENQEAPSSLTASQEYLQEHVPANNGNTGWINKATSAFKNINLKNVPSSIGQYGTTAATRVKNMSTTQKIAGGALLAAGAYYLANRNMVNTRIQTALNRKQTVQA